MRIRRLAVLPAVLAVALAGAPAAHADAFQDLFREYQKTGKVDGCKHSAKKLNKASREVPNDIEQYAPDFPAALETAAAKKASGKCARRSRDSDPSAATGAAPGTGSSGGTDAGATATQPDATATTPAATTPAATAPAGATPAPTPDPKPAAPVADDAIPTAATGGGGADDAPAPLLLLFLVGGMLLAAGLGWAAAQWAAWEPAWALRARHAGAEAGWRASAAWAEFRDWVRLGR